MKVVRTGIETLGLCSPFRSREGLSVCPVAGGENAGAWWEQGPLRDELGASGLVLMFP